PPLVGSIWCRSCSSTKPWAEAGCRTLHTALQLFRQLACKVTWSAWHVHVHDFVKLNAITSTPAAQSAVGTKSQGERPPTSASRPSPRRTSPRSRQVRRLDARAARRG